MKKLYLLLAIAVALCSCTTPIKQINKESSLFASHSQIEKFEQQLKPLILFKARRQEFSLDERMNHFRVPGISIAVIHQGKIILSKGYGVKDTGTKKPVNHNTVFQAASISKPITALGALLLVDKGHISIDDDVNNHLKRWMVPKSQFTKKEKVTLRRILSHGAGLTVSGFLGYVPGEKIPTAVQVLNGKGNSEAVEVDAIPGTTVRYSGGGTVVAQVLIEDVTDQNFPDWMKANVLDPLQMQNSYYEQPLSSSKIDHAAFGHIQGQVLPNRWHIYPELGPAGLWSTPVDLAKAIIKIQNSFTGKDAAKPLNRDLIRKYLTPQNKTFGLGPKISKENDFLIFEHGGSNEGYKARWLGFINENSGESGGIVVLTNANTGNALIDEIFASIAKVMSWRHLDQQLHKEVEFKALTNKEKALVGRYYRLSSEEPIFITENDGQLNFWGHELYKINDFAFGSKNGDRLIFRAGEDSINIEVEHFYADPKQGKELIKLSRSNETSGK